MAQKCGENSLPECPDDYKFDTATLNCADEDAKAALTKAASDLAAADKAEATSYSRFTQALNYRAIQCLRMDMDKACAEFEGYNDEIKTQLDEDDGKLDAIIGVFERLIA